MSFGIWYVPPELERERFLYSSAKRVLPGLRKGRARTVAMTSAYNIFGGIWFFYEHIFLSLKLSVCLMSVRLFLNPRNENFLFFLPKKQKN